MKRLRSVAIISAAILLASAPFHVQAQLSSESSRNAEIAKLFPPVYPPLARQARITGEVRIELRLRQSGTVESADLVAGHPMLVRAALESARKSEFACTNCVPVATVYSLVYDFEIREGCHFGPHCQLLDSDQTVVTQSPGRVVIVSPPACLCDPVTTLIRSRSAKCLYLWKCSQREVADE